MTLLLLLAQSSSGSVVQTVHLQAAASLTGVSIALRSQDTGVVVDTSSASEILPGSGVYSAAFSDVPAATYFVQLVRDSDGVIIRYSDLTLALVEGYYAVSGGGNILSDGASQATLLEVQDTVDAIAVGGGGGTVSTAVVVARVPVGSTAGWPQELIIGDAYLTATGTAPSLFIKDIDDTILSAMGSKGFADADFVGTLRLSPLTSATRDLDTPATTIEVDSADTPGIVFNDTTPGAEYFELQIPNAQTILGVIKTRYSAQFIMNWGITREYESSVNLGEIKFIRKNAAAV